MDPQELLLPVEDGVLAVLDHGGNGPAVFIIPGPAYTAAAANAIAAQLSDRAHVYAVDPPGNGHSSLIPRNALHAADSIATALAALALDRPILVGIETSGFTAAVIAVKRPDLVGGVVLASGLCLRDWEINAVGLEFATSDEFLREMQSRFLLGVTGQGESARREMIARLGQRLAQDWATADTCAIASADMERGLTYVEDDTWVVTPTLESLRATLRLPPDTELRPEPALLKRITAPLFVVVAELGDDGDTFEDAAGIVAQIAGATYVPLVDAVGVYDSQAGVFANVVVRSLKHRA
ncbi:alpha/beta fold hydrolase [Gephyromycinifex aptenodytis]|uniref:alpha/beta fold hydrolase n=1 Tax=Gephyromycinifex aptenodytis TaxID=2716227 RepID=UPI0014469318|nr:alpha/beta hydrolase [Gephyromycinifex aptenodytis]